MPGRHVLPRPALGPCWSLVFLVMGPPRPPGVQGDGLAINRGATAVGRRLSNLTRKYRRNQDSRSHPGKTGLSIQPSRLQRLQAAEASSEVGTCRRHRGYAVKHLSRFSCASLKRSEMGDLEASRQWFHGLCGLHFTDVLLNIPGENCKVFRHSGCKSEMQF